MRIVADESVDFGIIKRLRQKNFTVTSVSEQYSGIKDEEVLKLTVDNQCLLITEDKDFGELTFRLQHDHYGILLIRLTGIPRVERIDIITNTIINHKSELYKKFSVIDNRGLRIKTAHNKRYK